MSKILAIFFINIFLFANINFDHAYQFELKKDQIAKIELIEKSTKIKEVFDFSWTLYDNTNIILHTKFRKFPRQIVLSLRKGLELYKQILLPNFKPYDNSVVEIYLEFLKFQDSKAIFDVKILDANKRVDVHFIEPRGKNVR